MGRSRPRTAIAVASAGALVAIGSIVVPTGAAAAVSARGHVTASATTRAKKATVTAAASSKGKAAPAPNPISALLGAVGSVLGSVSGSVPGSKASAPATGSGPAAQVWVTTADGSQQLAPAASASFGGARLSDDIAVDTGATEQRFSGAGASITESAAAALDSLPAAARTQLVDRLFSADGLHLSYLRQPLGASDFVTHEPFYTYEDTQGSFDYSRDGADVIPLVKAAEKANPDLQILGTPWSAPAWMKTSGSLTGGSLKAGAVQEYADYLVAVAKHYAAVGAPLSDLTVENEPGTSAAYPSMTLSVDQEAAVLKAVDAALTKAGLSTRLWVGDDNWSTAGDVLTALQKVSGISRVQGAAFHCYSGDPSEVAQIVRAGWRVYDTECSGTDSATPAATFHDTLLWQTQNLVVSAMRSGAETVMLWNLALDGSGGPQFGDCGTRCNGVVQIQDGTVTDDAQYDVLGQLTKFVDVGAHVVSSTSGGTGGVEDVAFVNPDGSRVVLVLNDSGSSQAFSITADGSSLDYTLPGSSVATFVWK